jgi:hypothetical protein
MTVESHGPVSIEDLVRYQGLFIGARARDRAYIAEGGTIYYVMDSNIAGFFADPPSRALEDARGVSRRLGYAAIFKDDPPEAARALASALADYLLNDLSPELPLLLIPPMDRMVFDWMRVLQSSGPSEEQQQKLRSEADSLLAMLTNSGVQMTLEQQEEAAATIQKLLFLETGTPATLRDLTGATRSRRIASANISALGAVPLPERLRAVLQAEAHWVDENTRAFQWRDRIKTQTNRRSSRSIEIQSRALARLELWNDRLNRTGGNARLVFVTGDSVLIDAGADFKVDENSSFTDRYLRHPRAYLADVPLLQQIGRAEQADGDGTERHWLQLWPRQLHQDGARELIQTLKAKWTDFLSSATASYRQRYRGSDQIADHTRAMANGFDNWQAQNNERLEERTAEFWEDCFFVATQARIILGQAEAGQPSARNAPPLYLAGWPRTSKFVERLLAWSKPGDFDLEIYQNGVNDLRAEVTTMSDRDDVNNANVKYAYYLAHAALFAGRGDWAIAANVAAEACRHIAPAEEKTPERANGREAYYMQAVCGRYSVRNIAEIDTLEAFLEKAEYIARLEHQNVEWHDCVPERFEAERLGLRLTKVLFETYHTGPGSPVASPRPSPEFPWALVELIPEFDSFWKRVSQRKQDAEAWHHTYRDNIGFELRASILRRVELRTVGSLLSVAVMDPSPDSSEVRSTALAYMKSLPEEGPDLRVDPFARFVIACAELRMATTDSDKALARARVDALRNDDGIAKATIFPYDRVRLDAIWQAALKYS